VLGALPSGTLIKDAEVAARLGVSITPVPRGRSRSLPPRASSTSAPTAPGTSNQVTQKNALELGRRF